MSDKKINAFCRIGIFSLVIGFIIPVPAQAQERKKPNIIILFADDMGYGDLGSYGNPNIRTPYIDSLAAQGIRFTSYEAAPWCVPSRVELLTGRYAPRVNLNGHTGADGTGGLPDDEVTLAEGLNKAGYATGMAGKWHLGYKEKRFLPTNQGFDSWLGLPYSNDYKKPYVQTDEPLVMYRDTSVVEYPVNQDSLTVKYTQEAMQFINHQSGSDAPFFFYLAYNMPHLPIHTTRNFFGKSDGGLYGDVIQTIDWSVGEILQLLKEKGIADNTIVFFASDNGPWQNAPDRMFQVPDEPEGDNGDIREKGNKPWHVGSTGPLRGHKATTWEGGTRVPAIIRWPGKIKPGQVRSELVTNLDMYRTLLELGGGVLPEHILDGYNMEAFFRGQANQSPRNKYAYFYGTMEGMRIGKWKLKISDESAELFNLESDPAEKYNRFDERPDIVKKIRQAMVELAKETKTDIKSTKSSR